ncbi:adenylyl-sulfate kinase [Rheinheimera baltica]|uniref:Adenylyl-sulfate kinase n=1 Tax=Rheinheimera baltica TaxID=67576 RepID=A0ABT9I3D5_9GAMM|nr:adenylyl-sulfate kinase [Rheinheimera baltica]MDP5137888.1 adenylyl-sulfate kinase [Rheinheimera baltica]MDP5149771.1 adenylyl-sulfate kinase [Rheinheimera baltica]
MNTNIVWHPAAVSASEKRSLHGHNPCVLWYTGLSGSGKSTISNAVDRLLFERGCHTFLLDGDNVRHGLNRDLGFDDASRVENIRRISEVSKLMLEAGLIVGTAFISPFIADRQLARSLIGASFIEVFIDTPLHECEKRDPKGLYQKARAGDIKHFTGISSPYEAPMAAELHIRTTQLSIREAAEQIVHFLEQRQIVAPLDME